MNIRKLFIITLLWFVPLTLFSQRYVSGRVTGTEDGESIAGASVFITNTTVGITTDSMGYYRLKMPGPGSYTLAVSHAGYQPFFKDIGPGQKSITLNASMHIRELEEVTVAKKVKARKEDIDLFWKTILGKKPAKNAIFATNPGTVYYYYNHETNILTVTCHVPLQITNLEAGYQIEYVLDKFIHDYNTHTTHWDAQFKFTELEPVSIKQEYVWKINREKIYCVSVTNFIRSLYDNSLNKNGFLLSSFDEADDKITTLTNNVDIDIFNRSKQDNIKSKPRKIYLINPESIISIDPVNHFKTLTIPKDSCIMLVCFGQPISDSEARLTQEKLRNWALWSMIGLYRNQLETPDSSVCIFPDGTYKNTLKLSPKISSNPLTGLNMMLPIDYNPDIDSNAIAQVADTIADYKPVAEDSPQTGNIKNPLADSLKSVVKRFERQLSEFPQEKIYLQTDKPYYLSGERIWFRAHIVDAASHVPDLQAGSVFVELFDARDSLVCRVKVGFDNDAFSGYIPIPEEIPEGDYTVRAYTNTMQNYDEDYFFMKNIRIANPLTNAIHASAKFDFRQNKKINADIRFSNLTSQTPFNPESVKISINSGKPMNVKSVDGEANVAFNLDSKEKQRIMLLDAVYDKQPYQKYVRIPLPEDDFDVSFYPEGGQALCGCKGRIAFKTIRSDGTEIDVSGIVYDREGNEITRFKTDVRGMGQFLLMPKQSEAYYAVCANGKGQSKRFDLPAAKEKGYALSATWNKDRLFVKVLHPDSQAGDTLCLVVHTRGMVQNAFILKDTNEPVVFDKNSFPSGVSCLLLLTKDMLPLSERLVFVNNEDQANVACVTDKDAYPVRSMVEDTVKITDESGEPLSGNFSVSVTDDYSVAIDTTSNILTFLLLSPDLHGRITDPAFYFRKNTQSEWAAELLMLTQGWRRYDTKQIVRNDFIYPDTLLERGIEISGTVKDYSSKKPEANADVNFMTLKGDYFGNITTDSNGRFYMPESGAPDSTRFIIRTIPQTGDRKLELTLDKVTWPERVIPAFTSAESEQDGFIKYADKAERQYINEHGIRTVQLKEVTVTAQKKSQRKSSYYTTPDRSINETEIDRFPPSSMVALLNRLPGVRVANGGSAVYINRFGLGSIVSTSDSTYKSQDCPAKFLVDDIPAESIGWIEISDVAQVDLLTSPTNLAAFGTDGACGVIAIYTRMGKKGAARGMPNIGSIVPLGFQKPVEFYAPKYETPDQNTAPDLRTTIHWQPNLTTDETGTASFSFYTADAPSTYSIVIEGVTDDGKIIYKRDKIVVGATK